VNAHDGNRNRALITGVGGQDGYFLADALLKMGYEVHGIDNSRTRLNDVRAALSGMYGSGRLSLRHGDITIDSHVIDALEQSSPTEVYNLAAMSQVHRSFDRPGATFDVNGAGALRVLKHVRHMAPQARFYQASTAEMFGVASAPQNEQTSFAPVSPYARAKLYGHRMVAEARQNYGMFACSGILFNHESTRRAPHFVTRKVTRGIARILSGRADSLELGNMCAERDWGHAREYVRAMWLMLQMDSPDDYVIGTGITRSVGALVNAAFARVHLDPAKYVRTRHRNMRPSDPPRLQADPSAAASSLGWRASTSFEEVISEMLQYDLASEGLSLFDLSDAGEHHFDRR